MRGVHKPGRTSARSPADGRAAAFSALQAYEAGRTERVGEFLDRHGPADPREAGFARELALGALRHRRLYDALADRFLRRGHQADELRTALRLAAHQLFGLDQVPPHAACATTVELLRNEGHAQLTGVANAVARRLSELRLAERRGEGPLGRLAPEHHPATPGERHSLPDELIADLRQPLADGGEGMLAALGRLPHLCTRNRPGRPLPTGRSILRQDGPWTWWDDPQEALRGPVADGLCVVQDRAQGHLVELARCRPGELVLDLCAAPGGKSLAFLDQGCRVVSADLSPAKAARLRANLPAGAIVVQDGRRPALAAGFDVVVVDAPCSNTGVLARRPEARWRYDRRACATLAKLQRALLASAAALVAPGGRLVYATCSVVPAENQGIAHGLDGWRVLGERRSWPDEWQGGGYVAVLVR